jgi:ABC-type multidrug transport system permease subunit
VEHRAPMKSFQALRSPAITLTSFHDLPLFLILSSVVLAMFCLVYLFFRTPEDSNLMRLSLFLLLLYVMCVHSSSEFLLASVW